MLTPSRSQHLSRLSLPSAAFLIQPLLERLQAVSRDSPQRIRTPPPLLRLCVLFLFFCSLLLSSSPGTPLDERRSLVHALSILLGCQPYRWILVAQSGPPPVLRRSLGSAPLQQRKFRSLASGHGEETGIHGPTRYSYVRVTMGCRFFAATERILRRRWRE